MISNLFNHLSSYSWVIETGIVSLALFGEYRYPQESDFE